jgi:hypothetical protein
MISCTLRPSRTLIAWIVLLYLGAGVVWLQLPIARTFKMLGCVFHALHFYITWYHTLSLQAQEAIITLQYAPSQGWRLYNHRGDQYQAILQSGSVCTRHLIILRFKLMPTKENQSVMILPDSLPDAVFRKLCQRLWWGL